MVEIRQTSIAEIVSSASYEAMISAYAAESAIVGVPECKPNINTYLAMESAGLLHCFGAFVDDDLVGMLLMTVSQVPQYGCDMASIVIFYVSDECRKGGTGKHLIDAAESIARHRGAVAILMGAPANGRLAKAAPLMGFKGSHISFSKVLS